MTTCDTSFVHRAGRGVQVTDVDVSFAMRTNEMLAVDGLSTFATINKDL